MFSQSAGVESPRGGTPQACKVKVSGEICLLCHFVAINVAKNSENYLKIANVKKVGAK